MGANMRCRENAGTAAKKRYPLKINYKVLQYRQNTHTLSQKQHWHNTPILFNLPQVWTTVWFIESVVLVWAYADNVF